MDKTTLLLIGGAIIIGLLLVFGNRNSVAVPPGPNTPFNTSGTAPYKPFASTSTPPGPSVAAASVASAPGLLQSIANLFKPSQQNVPAGPGQSSGYPVGQAPLNLLSQNTIPVTNPAVNPIPLPSGPGINYAAVDAPTGIVNPSINVNTDPLTGELVGGPLDLSSLATAPPSPLTSPADFGASMDAAITNPSYFADPSTINSTPANYASPSYPYDGGEIPV
jgi:hypothetical protein